MTDQAISNSDPRSFPNSIAPIAGLNLSAGIVVRMDTTTDNTCTTARADTEAHSRAVGVCRRYAALGDPTDVAYAGPVHLTEDEWDVVAGTEGGLAVGVIYYLSSATAGHLTATAPGNGVPVGIALSSTALLVNIANIVEGS